MGTLRATCGCLNAFARRTSACVFTKQFVRYYELSVSRIVVSGDGDTREMSRREQNWSESADGDGRPVMRSRPSAVSEAKFSVEHVREYNRTQDMRLQ
ncbi:hypothetical protein MRX96_009054 [Rhipicephalus microplus]